MKFTIKVDKEVDIKTMQVEAGNRYWEDATVNYVDDVEGVLIPCRKGDCWCPKIDVETGQILNWTKGTIARIHYKICDSGAYYLLDENDNKLSSIVNDYVPKTLCPGGYGWGDYIIMNVDENGFIENWKFNINDFLK